MEVMLKPGPKAAPTADEAGEGKTLPPDGKSRSREINTSPEVAAASPSPAEAAVAEAPAKAFEALSPSKAAQAVSSPPAVDRELPQDSPAGGSGIASGDDPGISPTVGSDGPPSVKGPLVADFGTRDGPRVLWLATPEYPLLARRRQKEGRVVLRLTLDRNGSVGQTEVVEPAGYGFDESALAAVQKSRFLPASRNGEPVRCLALLTVRFSLHPEP
jgi:protein TonB